MRERLDLREQIEKKPNTCSHLVGNQLHSTSIFQIQHETNVRILMDHMAIKEELEDKLTVMRADIERMESEEAENATPDTMVNF